VRGGRARRDAGYARVQPRVDPLQQRLRLARRARYLLPLPLAPEVGGAPEAQRGEALDVEVLAQVRLGDAVDLGEPQPGHAGRAVEAGSHALEVGAETLADGAPGAGGEVSLGEV
jgi:hypothetical protein